jgi:hypothetical protein
MRRRRSRTVARLANSDDGPNTFFQWRASQREPDDIERTEVGLLADPLAALSLDANDIGKLAPFWPFVCADPKWRDGCRGARRIFTKLAEMAGSLI